MRASRERAVSLSSAEMNGSWEAVRSRVLWAAGLRDLPDAAPGRGYTGHAFNDANHCDATTMLGEVSHDTNDGSVKGIAVGNLLGPGIEIASLPELGPGGSWSTCTNGCHLEPPQDVRALTPPLKCGSYTPAPRPARRALHRWFPGIGWCHWRCCRCRCCCFVPSQWLRWMRIARPYAWATACFW